MNNKGNNPFDLDFMDDYYDNLMEEKMRTQIDPFSMNDSRFSLESLLGNSLKNIERDQANAFIDAYYMEEYDEMEKEFLENLMMPKEEPKPKYDYKKIKHLSEFKNLIKEKEQE